MFTIIVGVGTTGTDLVGAGALAGEAGMAAGAGIVGMVQAGAAAGAGVGTTGTTLITVGITGMAVTITTITLMLMAEEATTPIATLEETATTEETLPEEAIEATALTTILQEDRTGLTILPEIQQDTIHPELATIALQDQGIITQTLQETIIIRLETVIIPQETAIAIIALQAEATTLPEAKACLHQDHPIALQAQVAEEDHQEEVLAVAVEDLAAAADEEDNNT